MKNIIVAVLITCSILPYFGYTQASEVNFETHLSWEAIQQKAKTENRYIFVDCYATWCGPCKFMDKNIFSTREAGDFFNKNFINAKFQLDETPGDSSHVKARYADARMLANTYHIGIYPTYLYFSPDGQLVHRVVGASATAQKFITLSKDALDDKKQYYSVVNTLNEYKTDTATLRRLVNQAVAFGDVEHYEVLGNAYLNALHGIFTREELISFSQTIQSSKSKGFAYFIKNKEAVNKLIGREHMVERKLAGIVFQETFAPLFRDKQSIDWTKVGLPLYKQYASLGGEFKKTIELYYLEAIGGEISELAAKATPAPDWNNISSQLSKRFVHFNYQSIFLEKRALYYRKKQMWVPCEQKTKELLSKYGDKIPEKKINEIVWSNIFLHGSDPAALAESIKWMRKVVETIDDAECLDTYANLLFKNGQKQLALEWENKALELAQKINVPRFITELSGNLNKMKNGEPTWINK
jgi:thiol-disulfide isomerase/thioredoxin